MTRKRWALLLALPLVAQVVGCASYPARATVGFHETVDLRETVGLEGVREVLVETRNGSIEVQADPGRKDLDVQAEKSSTGLNEQDARTHAESISIHIGRDLMRSDVLRITAQFPPSVPARSRGVAFAIKLPPGLAVRAETSNGRVRVTDVKSDVKVKTSNGRIFASNVNGTLDLRTSNGSVVVKDVVGGIEIRTSNGKIEMARIEGDRIKATTSNGRILAEEITGAPVLRTSNGRIELRVASVPENPDIRATNSNGRVHVELPETVKATLRMRTSNGRIHADLKGASVEDVESERMRFKATLNGGGGSIEITSSNDSVTFQTTRAGG